MANGKIRYYSETYWDSRTDDPTHESRLHLDLTWPQSQLTLYTGLTYSLDINHPDKPMNKENYVAPHLGAHYQALSFLYPFLEARRLLRSHQEINNKDEFEFRFGFYAYHFVSLSSIFFNEVYSDLVGIDRISYRPVFTIWNKTGLRWHDYSWSRLDLYHELFVRESPNPLYGVDEQDLRIGIRQTFLSGYWALGIQSSWNYVSNIDKGGFNILLTLSRVRF